MWILLDLFSLSRISTCHKCNFPNEESADRTYSHERTVGGNPASWFEMVMNQGMKQVRMTFKNSQIILKNKIIAEFFFK